MNGWLNYSKIFFKRNMSTILTCIGGAGVITTSIMAAKATPKALKLLEQARVGKDDELTKIEVVKVAGPVYIPTFLVGAGTLACIFGANILNKRQQAALMSAYALLDNSYKEYKNKVDELFGEEADQQVREEIAKDNYKPSEERDNNLLLFYDEFSERYFESTELQVLAAEYELNHIIAQYNGVYLNEFYELLGVDTIDYGNYLGWSAYELADSYWYCWVEFEHRKITMNDGRECCIISMVKEPTFDFEKY